MLRLIGRPNLKASALLLRDACHKRALPRFPRTVGVVTSAQGAAVRGSGDQAKHVTGWCAAAGRLLRRLGWRGAGLALAALPAAGQTLAGTAGLYLAGGPGGYVAQQALTRQILDGAGYDKLADRYDPLDPVGLALSGLVPLPFAAVGYRNARAGQAARNAEALRTAPMPSASRPRFSIFPTTPTAEIIRSAVMSCTMPA